MDEVLADRKSIMFQGTASNVGKSLIVTALCRIMARDKMNVSPFKSWNMSLNYYVTNSGGEIGIAQALQAKAAGIEPVVDMQPILVKPKTKGFSQVFMWGKPFKSIRYNEKNDYYLKKAKEAIRKSLNNLHKKYEYIIMEGAGSPAEINRQSEDLANMNTAQIHHTPVILVADIDKGGVFASLVGTMELLKPKERELVQGFVINKFRGDIEILKPGIDYLENRTGRPVVGVLPYISDIKLPEEDIDFSIEKKQKMDSPFKSNSTNFKNLKIRDDNIVYRNPPAGEFDRLADIVSDNLDLNYIYSLLG